MGIRPNGSGAIPPVTPDNPETRYSDWLTDLEDSGEIVGGVWQETDAKASSGNDGVTDLAGRLAALEAVSSISGTGWRAHRWGRIVTVFINGATSGFTLPVDFAPANRVYVPIAYGKADLNGRVFVNTTGEVQLIGASGGVYAVATYLIE